MDSAKWVWEKSLEWADVIYVLGSEGHPNDLPLNRHHQSCGTSGHLRQPELALYRVGQICVCSWGVWWQIWIFRFVGQDWQHIWHPPCLCAWIVFGRAPSWLVVNVCELTSLKHIIAPVPMCHRISASLHQQLIPVYAVKRISEFYFSWVFTSCNFISIVTSD